MKISTEKLIAAIDDAIDAGKAKHARNYEAELAKYETAIAAWRQNTAPGMLEAARVVVERLRKDRPITEAHLKPLGFNYYAKNEFLSPSKPADASEPKPSAQITALRNFLLTVDDEFVSPSSLRDLGFRNFEGLLTSAVV